MDIGERTINIMVKLIRLWYIILLSIINVYYELYFIADIIVNNNKFAIVGENII